MDAPVFHLTDYDHEEVRHCTVTVQLQSLTLLLEWELEYDNDDLDDDAQVPEGFAHTGALVFDELGALKQFFEGFLVELSDHRYQLYLDGHETEVKPGLIDLGMLADKFDTAWRIRGNITQSKLGVEGLERAYHCALPETVRDFLSGPRWRAWDRATLEDLPAESGDEGQLGCGRPVVLDLMGPSLEANRELYAVPEMCAFGQFFGQALGLNYFGVVQAAHDGTIWISTGPEDCLLLADDLEQFLERLDRARFVRS